MASKTKLAVIGGGSMLLLCCCCCCIAIGLLMYSTTSAAASATSAPGSEVVTNEMQRAGHECIVLYDNVDGSGDASSFCLDGLTSKRVNNLKDYQFNDRASAMDVGSGVSVRAHTDAGLRGDQAVFRTAGFQSLKGDWKNDAMSSFTLTQL
jgi:hypothetical protein